MRTRKNVILVWFLTLSLLLCACQSKPVANTDEIPPFSGEAYVAIHNNEPVFSEKEKTTKAFETYTRLDSLGRCGVAMACVGREIMPTEERGSIGQVKPSGWQTVKYDCVDGKYLYNRCHLIGYQLTGENANERNLITGTRYLNIEGMLPFENMVADYVKETENHVIYRVTPVYTGNNLVADGVIMEGYSVEDEGEGICFHIYAYNCQPGVVIDYATGESRLEDGEQTQSDSSGQTKFVCNANSKKFHLPTCSGAEDIKAENRKEFTGSRETLIQQGYNPCKNCNP